MPGKLLNFSWNHPSSSAGRQEQVPIRPVALDWEKAMYKQ